MLVPTITLEDRRAIVSALCVHVGVGRHPVDARAALGLPGLPPAHRVVLRFALDLWEGRDSLTVGELLALPVALRCVLCALLAALGDPEAVRDWHARFITSPPPIQFIH